MRVRNIDPTSDVRLYICDPDKNSECYGSSCYTVEGPCHLTLDKVYKASFIKALFIKILCKIKKY